jgi:uncharacterized protein (TIGR03000 family)
MLQLLLFTALTAPAAAQDKPAEEPAQISVRLPADAKLYIDEFQSLQTGPMRTLDTPPLKPGNKFHYTLRAEFERDGRRTRVTKEIWVRAGQSIAVELGLPPGVGNPANPAKPKPASFQLSKQEQELLDLTNKERTNAGLQPLKADGKLFDAARAHSANMAKQDSLNHTLDDKGPAERLSDVGYRSFGWGENIAYGQRTPGQAIETWMNSPGHRANILNDSFTELGLGIVANDGGVLYYTQVFARPAR